MKTPGKIRPLTMPFKRETVMQAVTKLPIIPDGRADDLHGLEYGNDNDLCLFMAGNQFMVMEELLEAFTSNNPDIKRIVYETLPPGLELKQILARGALFRGKQLDLKPDVYASVNLDAMQKLVESGHIDPGGYRPYLHNRLTLMVPAGNPAGISALSDLAEDNVRISQPDPANEDIAFHIIDMYREAGGDALVAKIMEEKRAEGTTIMTVVHHRETPLRIAKGTVDVGPVWATEVIHAQNTGLACEQVEPGEQLDQRDKINYYVCSLNDAPHPEAAGRFIDFLLSDKAGAIYSRYGFVPHRP